MTRSGLLLHRTPAGLNGLGGPATLSQLVLGAVRDVSVVRVRPVLSPVGYLFDAAGIGCVDEEGYDEQGDDRPLDEDNLGAAPTTPAGVGLAARPLQFGQVKISAHRSLQFGGDVVTVLAGTLDAVRLPERSLDLEGRVVALWAETLSVKIGHCEELPDVLTALVELPGQVTLPLLEGVEALAEAPNVVGDGAKLFDLSAEIVALLT